MALSSITKLSTIAPTEKNIAAMIKRKCRAYLAKGKIEDEFDNLNKTTLAALYGSSGVFDFLGDLAEDAGKFTTEQSETKTLFFTVPGSHTGTLTLNLVNVTDLIDVIDSDEVKEEVISVLLIPDGTDDEYIVFKEMTMGSSVTIELSGGVSIVSCKFFKSAETIGSFVGIEKDLPDA